jgi:hypothetical protein
MLPSSPSSTYYVFVGGDGGKVLSLDRPTIAYYLLYVPAAQPTAYFE